MRSRRDDRSEFPGGAILGFEGKDLRCVGASHTMHEFSESHCRDGDLNLSEGLRDRCEQVFDRLAFSFRCDDYARIEDQSQEGGFHGWLRSLIPFSTSLPKPPSRITFEPLALAKA